MPPLHHLVRVRQQGVTDCLGASTTAAYRFEIASQMRPAHLTPPYRIPVGRTVTIRHQDAGTWLTQQLTGHLAPPRQPPPPHPPHADPPHPLPAPPAPVPPPPPPAAPHPITRP